MALPLPGGEPASGASQSADEAIQCALRPDGGFGMDGFAFDVEDEILAANK